MDSLSAGIRVPSIDCDGATLDPGGTLTRETISSPEFPPFCFGGWPGSDRNGGRDKIGSLAAIKS
jgi:hypothetical protein